MKALLSIVQAAACLLLLSGCSSYYYSILSSNDRPDIRNAENDFVQENDTLSISYCFYGEDAPVSITIYNKLDKPLYVDWTRSALIIDDVATSYYTETATVEGRTESSSYSGSYRWGKRSVDTYSNTYGGFNGSISLPKGVDFIPPKSKVSNTSLRLTNLLFDKIPNEAFDERKLPKADGSIVTVREKDFTEADTPLFFRSYLTLYLNSPEGRQGDVMPFERSFYISRLIKTGNVAPHNFKEGQMQSGDFFYVHNVKGAGAGLIIGAVAVGAATVAIGVVIDPTN